MLCSDGGLLLASKAGQSRAKFVFYDMNRHEVLNKVMMYAHSHSRNDNAA